MSTLETLAAQTHKDFDLFFIFQMGDGSCTQKASYQEYFKLAEKYGINGQLSPWDERVREVTRQVASHEIHEMELENDHALDSGAWYKFLKSGRWKDYDRCFFIQEGTLLTSTTALAAALEFSDAHDVHFLSAGHEKRRLSQERFLNYYLHGKDGPPEVGAYHDRCIQRVFDVFRRDPDFEKVFRAWGSGYGVDSKEYVSTENHVPASMETWSERAFQALRSLKHGKGFPLFRESIYVNGLKKPLTQVVPRVHSHLGVKFHSVREPEWFGASCQHLFSHRFLSELTARLEKYSMYEVLEIPFSGTPLEPVWGMMPNWLGYKKWFFDGIHRVRKNFVTLKREDSPEGMAKYINAYYGGQLKAVPSGEFEKIDLGFGIAPKLKDSLGEVFFTQS